MRLGSISVGAITAIAVGLASFAPAVANADEQLTTEDSVLTDFLEESANVAVDTSGENAIDATVGGVDVTIPTDPELPISMSTAGTESLEIHLPLAESASTGEPIGDSSLVYDNGDGSSTVPVVKKDGTLQFLSVLENADSGPPPLLGPLGM